MKTCRSCNIELPVERFSRNKRAKDGRNWMCKLCKAAYDRNRRVTGTASDVESKRRLRARVYEVLGGAVCACCGETNPLFLTLDHIHGDGHIDRQSRGTRDPRTALRNALLNPSRYQVLCFNCNCGRQRNGGVCPHKEVI